MFIERGRKRPVGPYDVVCCSSRLRSRVHAVGAQTISIRCERRRTFVARGKRRIGGGGWMCFARGREETHGQANEERHSSPEVDLTAGVTSRKLAPRGVPRVGQTHARKRLVEGLGLRVEGLGCRVYGVGCGVYGVGCGV